MKIIILAISILILTQFHLLCEEDPAFENLNFISYVYENDTLKIHCDNSNISIIPFTPEIIKVNLHTDFTYNSDTSYVVILKPQKVKAVFKDNGDYLTLSTDSLEIRIQKTPIKMQYYKKSDLLIEDQSGFFAKQGYRGIRMQLADDEAMFGGGSRAIPLNRSGKMLMYFNQNKFGYELGEDWLNTCIPLLISSKHYGIYIDNSSLAFNPINENNSKILQYNSLTGTFSYFLFIGNSYSAILQKYLNLTGYQPLPPRWALGYLQSKAYYNNTEELYKVLDDMQSGEFPLDAIIFDLSWLGSPADFGNYQWNYEKWGDHKAVINKLQNLGIKTVLITEPYIAKKSFNYKEVIEKNLFAKDTNNNVPIMNIIYEDQSLLDFFRKDTKEWVWNKYKNLMNDGISGWWCDMGEPDVHPWDLTFQPGFYLQFHNLFANEWLSMLSNGYDKDFPDIRKFFMTRAGWAGIQRYSPFPLCGDASRSYSQILAQIYIMLGGGLSGIGYLHSDIGGFTGSFEVDSELYTRWMQFGTFSPIMRAHVCGPSPQAEPVYYDESVQPILRKYMNLRYQLLPYNYNLSYQNTVFGYPLARPMFWYYDKTEFYSSDDQYFWGSSFLVAPIYDSASVGRNVVFPEGNWIDFWSNETISGNKTIFYPVDISKIPVFVKAGSIIPFAPIMMNTSKFNYDTLIFNYYPDNSVSKSSYDLYEDDGISPTSISNNKYFITKISAENKTNYINLNFEIDGNEYAGMSKSRTIFVKVIKPDFIPDSISIDNHLINYYKDSIEIEKVTEGYFYKDSILTCKFNWTIKPLNLQIFHTGNLADMVLQSENDLLINIFPNPFSEKIQIELNLDKFSKAKIEILDLSGSVVSSNLKSEINENKIIYEWNSKAFSKGVYFVKINNGINVFIRKILKL